MSSDKPRLRSRRTIVPIHKLQQPDELAEQFHNYANQEGQKVNHSFA
jgi:adenine C2-methylase RlmN of 23S rRNA A2503 and tRNA A37